jgi:hypothetical protein
MGNTALLSGTAIAVLAGVVLVVGPWFQPSLDIVQKLSLTALGGLLIFGGMYFSKG